MKTVFINGSPKKKLSVTSYLLGIVRLQVRGEAVQERLRNKSDHERILKNIKDADAVVFGLPLYVDGVPSHVLAFMKDMEGFCRRFYLFLQQISFLWSYLYFRAVFSKAGWRRNKNGQRFKIK